MHSILLQFRVPGFVWIFQCARRLHYFIAEGIFEQVGYHHPGYKMNQIRLSEYFVPDQGIYNYPAVVKSLNNYARGNTLLLLS